MAEDSPVTPVIPVKDPNLNHLARTLNSIDSQTHPVQEIIIMDSSKRPVSAETEGTPVRVIHVPECGIGEARRRGMNHARTALVAHMDEDAVLLKDTHFAEAVDRLSDPSVSAVGAPPFPIRGNTLGKGIALGSRFTPASLVTHYLVHDKRLCNGDRCIRPGTHRGEDVTLRRELKRVGEIERMDSQPVLKDLPTARQSLVRDIVVAGVAGAVSTGIGAVVRSAVE